MCQPIKLGNCSLSFIQTPAFLPSMTDAPSVAKPSEHSRKQSSFNPVNHLTWAWTWIAARMAGARCTMLLFHWRFVWRASYRLKTTKWGVVGAAVRCRFSNCRWRHLVHTCRVSFLGAGSDDRGAGSQTRLDPAERKHCAQVLRRM